MSKKRALQHFDLKEKELAKAAERARWQQRKQIKQAAGYPTMTTFDNSLRRAVEANHGNTVRALDRLKKLDEIQPGSPQDSPEYVGAHYRGLEAATELATAWEAAQLAMHGL